MLASLRVPETPAERTAAEPPNRMLDVIARSGNTRREKQISENSFSKVNNITGCASPSIVSARNGQQLDGFSSAAGDRRTRCRKIVLVGRHPTRA
jgi:hypothetical protein